MMTTSDMITQVQVGTSTRCPPSSPGSHTGCRFMSQCYGSKHFVELQPMLNFATGSVHSLRASSAHEEAHQREGRKEGKKGKNRKDTHNMVIFIYDSSNKLHQP